MKQPARVARRRTDDTRRKLLAGVAVLNRVIGRVGRIRWMRKQLGSGLTRAAERSLFGLRSADCPRLRRA